MFESLKESLYAWNAGNGERVKLQHTYIIAAISLLMVAGIIGLINHELGQNVLVAAIVSAALFFMNAVVWSVLQTAILSRFSSRRPARKK